MLYPLCGTILLNSMHGLYASNFSFVSEHACVVSIPFLGRNVQSRFFCATDGRVDSTSILSMEKLYYVQASGLHFWLALVFCIPRTIALHH